MSNAQLQERQVRLLLRTSAVLLTLLAALALYGLWRTSREIEHAVPRSAIGTWAAGDGKGRAGGAPIVDETWDPQGIANFKLTDQHGNTVSKADLLGKPWVVCFIFTRCAGRCPAIIQSVNRLDKQLEDVDVRFVAISVDPKTDTPAVLKRYADVYQANSGRWLYLTGDQAAIHELIRRSFLMPVVENFGSDRLPGFEFAHSLQVLHVDAEGKVAGRYDPQNETDMVKLRRALQGSATGERG